MNKTDIARIGCEDGDSVDLTTAIGEGSRCVAALRIVAYDIPKGCCAS